MAWIKAGTTTLSTAGDDLDITSFTASTFNTILAHYSPTGGDAQNLTTFNNISTASYARRKSTNGGSDFSSGSETSINNSYQTDDDHFYVIYGVDVTGEEKFFIEHLVGTGGSGATVPPDRIEYVFKMVNDGDTRVTRVDFANGSAGSYDTDSNITVLGSDGTESLDIQDGAIYYDTDLNKEYVLYNNTWTEL